MQSAASGRAERAPFGITISCYRGDLFLLRGCLNSIRRYLPDMPICLIKHGSFPTDRLCERYRAITLEEADVSSRLREHSYGYGLTKMVAFWHSPFERFLHIDPDTVCWGDIVRDLPWRDYDLIYNEAHEKITPFIQRTQYFDPAVVFPAFPKFPWRGKPFFNTGVFAARRGIFDLDEYLELVAFQKVTRGSFFTDQGPLNFMAFKLIAEGRLTARAWPFQAVVPVIPPEELKSRFRFENNEPSVKDNDRRVIHWAGPKPRLGRSDLFDAPMTYHRLCHLRMAKPVPTGLGRPALVLEELYCRMTAPPYGGSYRAAALAMLRSWWRRAKSRLQVAAEVENRDGALKDAAASPARARGRANRPRRPIPVH
jgi:hypothetical protein